MIVKNEEAVLERCLSSVQGLIDEIIIVDTGSTDNTKQVARKFTNKIFDFKWEDDFSKARNFAFQFASSDYIMWLDADDVIPPESLKSFIKLKEEIDGSVDVYMLKYNTSFDEFNNPIFSFYRERIMKNDGSFVWNGFIHETIAPHGEIRYFDIAVEHRKNKPGDTWRNLNIYRKHIRRGEKLSARESYYYSRELFYHEYYKKCIDQLNKTLLYEDLWIEDRLGSIMLKATCLQILKKYKQSRVELFKSFEIAAPRAKALCMIGDSFLEENKYSQATYWYESAMSQGEEKEKNNFIEKDYFDYYPALNLCVCYFYLNNLERAEEYNNIALNVKPNDPIATNNKKFFKNKKSSSF